jgi:hypothetical protein
VLALGASTMSQARAEDLGVADAAIADASVVEQKLVRCKAPAKTKKVNLAAVLVQGPLEQCPPPRMAFCDAAGALAQCCDRGTTWSGTACVCDDKHHEDSGHCCADRERWVPGTAMSRSAQGMCCPDGHDGIAAPVSHTDVGIVGGNIIACCPPGQRLDDKGCYEAMPCEPAHEQKDARAMFVDCERSPVHRATSPTKKPQVTLGPIWPSSDATATAKLGAAWKLMLPQLRSCYERALVATPKAAGIIDVELVGLADGRVVARRVSPATGGVAEALVVCSATAVARGLKAPGLPLNTSFHTLLAFQHK